MNLYQLVAPASPDGLAISLSSAKLQCRIVEDDEDDLLLAYIAASQEAVESVTGRALSSQQWRLSLDRFPASTRPIEIPRPPLVSIDTFTYLDANGDSQAMVLDTDYHLDGDAEPALVYPPSTGWPTVHSTRRPTVILEYTCGHAEARPAPAWAIQVVRVLVGHCYENRELVTTGTIATKLPHIWELLVNSKVQARYEQ